MKKIVFMLGLFVMLGGIVGHRIRNRNNKVLKVVHAKYVEMKINEK